MSLNISNDINQAIDTVNTFSQLSVDKIIIQANIIK